MPQVLLYTSFILVNGHHACLNVSIGLVGGMACKWYTMRNMMNIIDDHICIAPSAITINDYFINIVIFVMRVIIASVGMN